MRFVNMIARWVEHQRSRKPAAWEEDVLGSLPLDGVDWIEASTRYDVTKADHDSGVRRQKTETATLRVEHEEAVECEKAEAAKPRVPTCFFCGEPTTAERLVVSHSQFTSVAICERCVAQCVTIIAAAKVKRVAGNAGDAPRRLSDFEAHTRQGHLTIQRLFPDRPDPAVVPQTTFEVQLARAMPATVQTDVPK
jgi:ClpX C4-type zinc finger